MRTNNFKSSITRILLILCLLIVGVVGPASSVVSADPLSDSEITALNEYPNWEASCSDSSIGSSTGSTTSSTSSTSGGGASDLCNGCVSIGGPSAGGPLLDVQFPQVSDTAALASNINAYIKSYNAASPLAGLGNVFVAAGQKYGVNPALMIGIAQKESSMGTNQPAGSHDAWGLTAVGDVANYPFINGLYNFPSWTVGIYESTKYVGDSYAKPGSTYYSKTVLDLMKHYTPPTYIQQTQVTVAVMQKIVNGLSIDGTASSAPSTPAVSTSDSCGSSNIITTTSASGYTNPFPNGWQPERLDMGYDGVFKDRIVSPCTGNMVYVNADAAHGSNGGWEGAFIAVACSKPIADLPSNVFYFAEGLSPTVTQGQKVVAGQTIAVPGWTGYSQGPGSIEWGLADPSNPATVTLAESGVAGMTNCSKASIAMVLAFSKWAQQNLSVAAPATIGDAGCT